MAHYLHYIPRRGTYMENYNFWDHEIWGAVTLMAVLLGSLLVANGLKRVLPVLKRFLIPSSVLGGLILLIAGIIYESITGTNMFCAPFFGKNGAGTLEVLTYHGLALGFIATTLKPSEAKFSKKRSSEIFDTGVTVVSSYLLQGVLGLGITIVAAMFSKKIFPAAGALLPFGYGQGTGQALNYGNIYEMKHGFVGGRSFGLTIAALGFLSASFGGVVHLNVLRKRGFKHHSFFEEESETLSLQEIMGANESPMNGSVDKLTIQLVLICLAYLLAYGMMTGLGTLFESMKSVVFGFNFLMGVIAAVIIKAINNLLMKKGIVRHQYINSFLMTRLSGLFFDIMIVAGIAAIRISLLKDYWLVILILAVSGAVLTYNYSYYIAKKLYPEYVEEQFMVTYGMLTGTASTGVMLLRELDPEFKTPASENMVYMNFPAMVFGFPLMLLATIAPDRPVLVLEIMAVFFVVMNVILFRSMIFKKKKAEKAG